ncbi:MAG TPA: hypothetical protein VEJ43_10830 [Pseudolabrys sp.]|nr:hypothetical protein [Pseudolabrys sp.]
MYKRSLWAVLGLAAMLAGCSASSVIDKLPADMGLPAGAPARPDVPYQYPAVHDMPPARTSVTMTEEEQVRLERELAAIRDRQEGRPQAGKKGASTAKTPSDDDDSGQAAGSKAKP